MRNYFTKGEWTLWGTSALMILVSFLVFDRSSYMTLAASLIGVTSLIFIAKGNPIGQFLMVVFSLFYGAISYTFSYFGEMVTYLGMSMPMAVAALVSWLRHPFGGNRAEVEVGQLRPREPYFLLTLTLLVSVAFYFILAFFGTANLIPSTFSVATSFFAVYLTFRRSPWFALAYAANDVVLIVLWTMAAMTDITYVSVIICFAAFLANDLYGFASWRKIQKRQLGAA